MELLGNYIHCDVNFIYYDIREKKLLVFGAKTLWNLNQLQKRKNQTNMNFELD